MGLSLQKHINIQHWSCIHIHATCWVGNTHFWPKTMLFFVNYYSEYKEISKTAQGKKQTLFQISIIVRCINVAIHLPCWKWTAMLVTNKCCCVLDAGVLNRTAHIWNQPKKTKPQRKFTQVTWHLFNHSSFFGLYLIVAFNT